MTTAPSFDDLCPTIPPHAPLNVQRWIIDAARWGATQGYHLGYDTAAHEVAFALWPKPITDRPPTEADGDNEGLVQYVFMNRWRCALWDTVAADGFDWLHTPRWQSRQPSPQKQVLEDLQFIHGQLMRSGLGMTEDRSRAISNIRRALKRTGEGQS
jgi:hypothetical protein